MENTSPHTPAPSPSPDAPTPDDPTADAWARARTSYLSGESATVVAARLGVHERTLRRRAQKEGWRRRDQPRPPMELPDCLVDWEPDDPDSPLAQFSNASDREIAELLIDPTPPAYLRHAFRRSAECAATGRVIEALHWTRLSLMLQRLHGGYPNPAALVTTPDRMRAAYGTALRAFWGECTLPDTPPPWPTEADFERMRGVTPVSPVTGESG